MATPIPTINQASHLLYIKPGPSITSTRTITESDTKPQPTEVLTSHIKVEGSTYQEPIERQFWQSNSNWKMTNEKQIEAYTEQQTSAKDTLGMPSSFRPGSQLFSLINQGFSDYESTSGKYTYSDDGTRSPLTDASNLNLKYGYNEDSFQINLTLSSGTKINFNVAHQTGWGSEGEDSVIAQVDQWKTALTISGEPLTDEDKATLAKLYEALDGAANKYLSVGRFDLSALKLEDLPGLKELSFELKGGKNKLGERLSLAYSNTESERTLDINLKGDKLALSLEKDGWALLSSNDGKLSDQIAAQKANSLEEYLQLIRDSAERGNASDQQADLMFDALRLLHSDEKPSTTGTDDSSTISKASPPLNYAATGLQSITGLADFSFSFGAKMEKPNQASLRSHEKISFDLNFAQETRGTNKKNGELAVQQTQAYQMSASYYKPLPWLELVDFSKQNYQYIETQASATQVTRLTYSDFQLQAATEEHQNSWSERQRTYVLGTLEKDIKDEDKNIDLVDFTEKAKSDATQMPLKYVNELLPVLDPWEK